jgi:ferrous iron transport protein B
MVEKVTALYPDLPNPRWVALRLLDGDEDIISAIKSGELGDLVNLDVEEDQVRELVLTERTA